MGKQSGEEQEESFEEDMRAFFESAVFVEKPKRERKRRERKYRRGRKGKTDPKGEKESPASLGTDLGAFFDNGVSGDQKDSKSEKKDEKESAEENLRGFFKEVMFEDQIRHDGETKAQSFMCPYCGTRLAMSIDACECGAAFVEEDKKIEAEITEFLDELGEEEELESEEDMEDEEFESSEPGAVFEAEAIEEDEIEAVLTVTPERLRRDRICFYVGSVLLLLGGPIITFGSLLHDWFSVPLVGTTYDAFGWLNVTYAEIGILILIIGIVLFAISLRGGIITNKELRKLKAKRRDA